MLRWTLGSTCLFPFWFPQCVCLAVGLLGHKAVLFPVFEGISTLFSIVAVLVCIPTNSSGPPEVMTLDTFVLTWIELKQSKPAPPCTVVLPQAPHFFLLRSQLPDLQRWAVGYSQASNHQAFCSDPGISPTPLVSHARGLLLSVHSLEKELHLKHTPWCDCRSTTHRNGYAGQGFYAAQGKIFCSISQAL